MRIFDIIKGDLNSDKLKLEEEIERVMNDKSLETNDKVTTIKKLLNEVTIIELSFKTFEKMITGDESENKEE